jgi:NADP-dependent 3-hydroxy acid dehydrogenase YdfG
VTFLGTSALVTGGASGIGAALGAALEEAGARVVLADIAPGHNSPCQSLDVRDAAAFQALVDDMGRVDLMINSAGISLGGATHEMSASHWDRVIDVNIRGVVNGVRAVYPSMVERGSGQIGTLLSPRD